MSYGKIYFIALIIKKHAAPMELLKLMILFDTTNMSLLQSYIIDLIGTIAS